jgi:ankyrin repeat protein
MARKKAQRKQEATLVPHRTPDLSALLENAKTGNSADAVKGYLDAGGSPAVVVPSHIQQSEQVPLLLSMVTTNAHPHRELAESVRLLVDAGADISTVTTDPEGVGPTALMLAAGHICCSAVLDILLRAGADPCVCSPLERMTALHFAAQLGFPERCELLLERAGSLLDMRDSSGWTALTYAAVNGRLDVVQLLVEHGADVNTVDNNNRTPALNYAVLQQRNDVVICLLQAGADVQAVDSTGHGVLAAAVQTNNCLLLQLLLSRGADIRVTNNKGQSLLFNAALAGHVSMMEVLVQHGLSVTALDGTGQTLLTIAASKGHKPAAEWLLQQGVAVMLLIRMAVQLYTVRVAATPVMMQLWLSFYRLTVLMLTRVLTWG